MSDIGDAPEDENPLARELRVLVGLRSRTAIRDRSFPALEALLPDDTPDDRDVRYAKVQNLLDEAIGGMRDAGHQRAATALLSSGPQRWLPLTQRGPEAANAFGLGWDAYRRRRDTTGTSLLQETLDELASTLSGDRPPLGTVDPPTPRRRTALVAAVAAIGLLAMAAGAAVIVRSRSDDRAVAPGGADVCGHRTRRIGEVAPGASDDHVRWSAQFARVAEQLGTDGFRCAGLVESTGGIAVQEVSNGRGSLVSAIVAADSTPSPIVLDHWEYVTFRAESLRQANPNRNIGPPVKRLATGSGMRAVAYANGTTVQEQARHPAFAVANEINRFWLANGGLTGRLGRPLTNAYDNPSVALTQDFVGGRVTIAYQRGSRPRIEPYRPADRNLPPNANGSILSTDQARDSWWVDARGVRHWLPSDLAFYCARDTLGAPVIENVPSVAIASLKPGRVYEACAAD